MFWQEDTPQQPPEIVTDLIVDLVFKIHGRDLPTEHGYALFPHWPRFFLGSSLTQEQAYT